MQNHLISGLKDLIKKYRLQEKILIVPDLQTGHQILQHLTKESPGWINIRPATVQQLSEDIVRKELIKKDIKIICPIESNIIIDGIFTELVRGGRLTYFKKNIINTGIIEAITGIITELKMSGIDPGSLDPKHFIDGGKAHDLELIYQKYQNLMQQKKLADYPDLIIMTLDTLRSQRQKHEDIKYLIPSRYANTPLEKNLINSLSNNAPIIIGEEKISGIPEPQNRWEAQEKPGLQSCFSYLFDIDSMPGDCIKTGIELFSAASRQNEVDEVLGRILKQKTSLDTVELIYTKEDPYLSIIYHTLKKMDIPAAFPGGLPGSISKPGKALKGIILWLSQDFAEIHVRRLLKDSLITTPASKGQRLAHALRTSAIGWGKDRYIPVLEAAIKDLSKEDDDKYGKKLEDLSNLKELVKGLLEIFSAIEPGPVELSRLSSACRDFLDTFVKPSGEEDARYAARLRDRLQLVSSVSEGIMPLEEAAGKIMDIIDKVPYGKASPGSGKLLVSGIASGGRSGKQNTYIIGFDNHSFPGTMVQDPILLDEERKNIGKELFLSRDRLRQKLFDLNMMLASLRGKITISCSSYDIRDNRSLFPASVYLQAYRLGKSDSSIDYEKMLDDLGKPRGFSSPHITGESGWWLNRLTGGDSLRDGTKSVFNIYPHLGQGSIALTAREGDMLTEYDGYIGTQYGLDPVNNPHMVLSCTALESYAACPYLFFLQYVLGAYRPEEVKKDPFQWLDAAQRGLLLHEVFQAYASGAKDRKPGDEKKDINSMLDKLLEKYRFRVPVPGRSAYDNEVARLRDDLEVFLELDRELEEVQHAEFAFGYKGTEPVEIDTGKGSLRLRGKIDRVDRDSQGNYHVWDYKTGSAYLFDADGYIAGGKQLQHILYAMVLEKVLGCSVSRCGYLLPTGKGRSSGKGLVFSRDPAHSHMWQEGLGLVLELIGSGLFIVSDEENPSYIEDTDIYGDSRTKKYLKQKMKNPENEILSKWRQLKDYR